MNTKYKKKSLIIFFIFILIYCIIIINLSFIQIWQNKFYTNLGREQYHVTKKSHPIRAEIFDRTGEKQLALNKNFLSAFILPKQLTNKKQLTCFLSQNFPYALKRLKNNFGTNFMFIKRKVTQDEYDYIKKSEIEDIKFIQERGRFYTVPSLSTVIGATDIDNNGIFGLELQYNKQLAGIPTIANLQQDARFGDFYFTKKTKEQGLAGKSINLTINSDLQFLAHEELSQTLLDWESKQGSALIMDPKNGEILTMVNVPFFDPNNKYNFNLEDTKNKILTDTYELGSVIKIFIALAALEEEVVTPEEIIDCKNKKTAYLDGRKINTVIPCGKVTFSEVIQKSNNIGSSIVAKRLNEKLYQHYKKLGFGTKTILQFPGQQSGFVNPPQNWSKQSIISLSYGYEITATLLQLARAFCIIARNGYDIQPKLILDNKPLQHFSKLYSNKAIQEVKDILQATTKVGTSKKANIQGYTIMSKTGTANLLVDGKYVDNKNIFTCAGIVEHDDYQRVIVVFVKETNKKRAYASTVAAPLFEKIAKKMLIHDKII